jgi:hypothetical protein
VQKGRRVHYDLLVEERVRGENGECGMAEEDGASRRDMC